MGIGKEGLAGIVGRSFWGCSMGNGLEYYVEVVCGFMGFRNEEFRLG